MGWIETRKLGLLLSVAPCRHGERKGGLNWKCNDAEKQWKVAEGVEHESPPPPARDHYSWGSEGKEAGW